MSFRKIILNCTNRNMFPVLSQENCFEQLGPHKQGAILVPPSSPIPIVRSTTAYSQPSQNFTSVHFDLICRIKEQCNIPDAVCNNVMVEIYHPLTGKMKFHTDQALDLKEDSYIFLFSCYEDEKDVFPGKLVVKEKVTGKIFEFTLEHHSVICWSTDTNRKYLHKIVSGSSPRTSKWLGLTFRQSKTFVEKKEDGFYFYTDGIAGATRLTLATEQEMKDLYKFKRLENEQSHFQWPEVTYTLGTH
jgi:hypothetical protein